MALHHRNTWNPSASYTRGVGPADNIKSEFLKQYYRREGKEHVQTWKEFSDYDADRREERRRMSRYSELSRTRQFNGNVSPRRSRSPRRSPSPPRRLPMLPGPVLHDMTGTRNPTAGTQLMFDKTPPPDESGVFNGSLIYDEGDIQPQATRGIRTLNPSRLGPTTKGDFLSTTMNGKMFPINPEQIASVSSDRAAAARFRKGARSPGNQMSMYLDAAIRKNIDLASTFH